MMWWGNWGGIGWWWLLGAVFWVGIIMLIIWGVREFTRRGSGGTSSALDIARERYARGEISREEFETIKKNL